MPGWSCFLCPFGGSVQNMANMSTVAFFVAYIFKQKGRLNGINSRKGALLLNIWGDMAALTLA